MDTGMIRAGCRLLFVLGLTLLLGGAPFARAEENRGPAGSIGLQVVPVATGELVVQQVVAGSPAARGGLKPGDLIVQIDSFKLAGSDFAETVAKRLWGREGSEVTVHYLRPGQAGRQAVKLRRAVADPKLLISPAVGDGAGTREKTR